MVLAKTLDKAIGTYLENGRMPSRKVNEIDNRGSSFYLALYWAQALSEQNEDKAMQERFSKITGALKENEDKIINELLSVQGEPVDLGGYFMPDPAKAEKVMRPSRTFNEIIDNM